MQCRGYHNHITEYFLYIQMFVMGCLGINFNKQWRIEGVFTSCVLRALVDAVLIISRRQHNVMTSRRTV